MLFEKVSNIISKIFIDLKKIMYIIIKWNNMSFEIMSFQTCPYLPHVHFFILLNYETNLDLDFM